MSAAAPQWQRRPRVWQDTGQWRTYKIPEAIAVELEEAISIARELNDFWGDIQTHDQAARLDALECVIADYLIENRAYLAELRRVYVGDSEYRAAALEALRRDGFRCVIPSCGKSGVNTGAVTTHHVIPRGQLFELRRIFGPETSIHEIWNLATVCEQHHTMLTDPPDKKWTWRNTAARLFDLTKNPDKAEIMRERGQAAI